MPTRFLQPGRTPSLATRWRPRPWLAAALLGLPLVAPPAALAQSLSGTLNATMRISTGCAISGASGGGTTGVNFGTLNFGTHPATFTGTTAASPSGGAGGTATTQIVCSNEITTVNITVNGGQNAGQGSTVGVGSRAMRSGSNFIPYEVYSDMGHTLAYPTTVVAYQVPTPGAPFNLPIYGQVNKTGAGTLPFGIYNDQLSVMLEF